MRSYLVDFENVKSKGLVGIDRLTEDDHVIIFYSDNSDTISFEMHCMVMRTKANVEYIKVKVGGKNALDFQLSTLLGYMVAKGLNTHIFIISNDKGFDKLHDFWENTFEDAPGCKVFRTQNISAAILFAKNNKAPVKATEESVISADIIVSDEQSIPTTDNTERQTFVVPEQMIESFKESEEQHDASGSAEDISAEPEEEQAADIIITETAERLFGSHDRHELLKRYMPEADDETIDIVMNAVIVSGCKLDLHNLLMKRLDNELSTKYYNLIKADYFYLKKVLPENSGEAAAQESPDTEATNSGENVSAESENQPKRVDTAMKKRLHAILDNEVTNDDFSGVVAQMNQSADADQLDANLQQRFGKERGGELYGLVKDEYSKFISADSLAPSETDEHSEEPAEVKSEESASAENDAQRTEAAQLAETIQPKRVDAAMKKNLHAILDGIATQDEFSGVVAQINQSATSQQLYINMMQRFKKDRGRELYKAVKEEYRAYIGGSSGKKTQKRSKTSAKQTNAALSDSEKLQKLHALLDDKLSAEEFDTAKDILNDAKSSHELYIAIIKKFRKSRGLTIYNAIKKDYKELIGA